MTGPDFINYINKLLAENSRLNLGQISEIKNKISLMDDKNDYTFDNHGILEKITESKTFNIYDLISENPITC